MTKSKAIRRLTVDAGTVVTQRGKNPSGTAQVVTASFRHSNRGDNDHAYFENRTALAAATTATRRHRAGPACGVGVVAVMTAPGVPFGSLWVTRRLTVEAT